MRTLRWIGALAFAAAVFGCSDEEEPLPYDPTTQNLYLRGTLTGVEVDISSAEAVEGEREYSPTRLCEVSAEFSTTIDGAPWAIDVELENFDIESFGVGVYSVVSSDVPTAPGQASFELRMDGDAAHYERSAIGGSIEVKVYESTAVQAGTPGFLEGGSLGAVFELDFGAGETVEGSFHVDFSITTIEDEEC